MKKINHLLKYALILVLAAGFSGCEKDTLTLLTDGVWKFKNLTTNSTDQDVKDNVTFTKILMTDSTIEFFGDGTYEMTSPLSSDPVAGTYILVGDTQLILTPDSGDPEPSAIDKLKKDELVLINNYSTEGGSIYSTTTTYVR